MIDNQNAYKIPNGGQYGRLSKMYLKYSNVLIQGGILQGALDFPYFLLLVM